MKWFKHVSDASDDIFIEELEEFFGWEGYGRWWKLLETIAKEMNETDNCYAEHSWVKWQSILKGKRNKLETFLVHCQDKEKITLECKGNILKITCPKLLDLRDEYSKKSGRTPKKHPDKLPPKREERRNKIEEERNKKEEVPKDNTLESVHTQSFKNLESDWQMIGREAGLDGEVLQRCFQKFKIHFEDKPQQDWVKAWKKWVLNEHKPTEVKEEKPLEGELLRVQRLGVANWARMQNRHLSSEQEQLLVQYEEKYGAVTWKNYQEWQQIQGKVA